MTEAEEALLEYTVKLIPESNLNHVHRTEYGEVGAHDRPAYVFFKNIASGGRGLNIPLWADTHDSAEWIPRDDPRRGLILATAKLLGVL